MKLIGLPIAVKAGTSPTDVTVQQRIRKLSEALLLTAGYYGSRTPLIRDFVRPRP
jgi:hypothetical protein